jgi:hypothetical protein
MMEQYEALSEANLASRENDYYDSDAESVNHDDYTIDDYKEAKINDDWQHQSVKYGIGLKIHGYDIFYKWLRLHKVSNPEKAQANAEKYLGKKTILFPSYKKDKKYMVINPSNLKWTHFGDVKYEDFLKHNDENRRQRYRARAEKIKGNWENDKYSANNLALEILW